MKSRKLSMLGQHQRLKKEAHCKIKARLGYKLSLSPAGLWNSIIKKMTIS